MPLSLRELQAVPLALMIADSSIPPSSAPSTTTPHISPDWMARSWQGRYGRVPMKRGNYRADTKKRVGLGRDKQSSQLNRRMHQITQRPLDEAAYGRVCRKDEIWCCGLCLRSNVGMNVVFRQGPAQDMITKPELEAESHVAILWLSGRVFLTVHYY